MQSKSRVFWPTLHLQLGFNLCLCVVDVEFNNDTPMQQFFKTCQLVARFKIGQTFEGPRTVNLICKTFVLCKKYVWIYIGLVV